MELLLKKLQEENDKNIELNKKVHT